MRSQWADVVLPAFISVVNIVLTCAQAYVHKPILLVVLSSTCAATWAFLAGYRLSTSESDDRAK